MNELISHATSLGISKEDAEYICSLDEKTKKEALLFLNSDPYIINGHHGTLLAYNVSIMDEKLNKIIRDYTNYNLYPLLPRLLLTIWNRSNYMEKGLKKYIFTILSLPAYLLSSPAVKIKIIKELLEK